jgi:hypothetical protein
MARISGKNVGEVYGHLPAPILERYREFYRSIWEAGSVDPRIKELIRFRSAQINECEH